MLCPGQYGDYQLNREYSGRYYLRKHYRVARNSARNEIKRNNKKSRAERKHKRAQHDKHSILYEIQPLLFSLGNKRNLHKSFLSFSRFIIGKTFTNILIQIKKFVNINNLREEL